MTKARGLADLGNVYSDSALSNRNLVINGAMQVAQRGTSATGVSAAAYNTVDRFQHNLTDNGVFTDEQSTDAPDGFASSFKTTCTTADAAVATGAFSRIQYQPEAQDLQALSYGTASAKDITVSFWVKSNVVADYVFWAYQLDAVREINRIFSVDVADTWEYKTVTIEGDTSGTINNDTGAGLLLAWVLASGTEYTTGTRPAVWTAAVNVNRWVGLTASIASTIGNYFQITGVQLEVGDTATPFEHRSYGQELALCQRYYYRLTADTIANFSVATGTKVSSSTAAAGIIFPTPMRAAATSFETNGVATDYALVDGATARICTAVPNSTQINSTGAQLNMTTLAGNAAGSAALLRLNALNSYIAWYAEL
jgi:hypothetical protein